MLQDVQSRLVKIRNEIRAQKVARELTYSQLLLPENTPSISYSAYLPVGTTAQNGIVARCRVRFTRSDGIDSTPFVNFPFSLTLSPTYKEFQEDQGVSVSGNDVGYVDEQCFVGYVAGAGTNYVDFYIDITETLITVFDPNYPGVTFSFTVEGVSTAPGTLTVTRIL